jgi:hypothetical protein
MGEREERRVGELGGRKSSSGFGRISEEKTTEVEMRVAEQG